METIIILSVWFVSHIVITIILCRHFYGNGVHDERMRVLRIINSIPGECLIQGSAYTVYYIIDNMKENA